MEIGEIKTNAFVKQNELECCGWMHEERLCITNKITVLNEENKIYCFHAYNIDRGEWGEVTNDQIILLDKEILNLTPLTKDCQVVFGFDGLIIGLN